MSFQQGLSGLNASSKALDVISNNVANSNTVGFKQSEAHFSDVYAASLSRTGDNQVGIGTMVSSISQVFTQGNVTVTDNPLDVAINGNGFFRMSQNGTISYTRNGQFDVDKNGYIVNDQGLRLTGYPADSSGTILSASPTDLTVDTSDLTPTATSTASVGLNLDSRESAPSNSPFSMTDPKSYTSSTALTVYDSLGNAHTSTMYFVKSATAGQWDMYTSLDGGAVGAATSLTFSSSGALSAVSQGGVAVPNDAIPQSVTVSTGAVSPLDFTMDFSKTTQFGSSFGVNLMSQNGFSAGRLSGLNIDEDGIVQARYSNGQSRNLGQVALANFTAPNGLVSLGNNQWAESSESGPPLVGKPGTSSLGVLQSSAVEESNVDLTEQLVDMITMQRAYQANAQSIKTEDQIMQTLVNLR